VGAQSSRVAASAGHYINSEKDVTSIKAHLITVINTILNELREHAFIRVSPHRRDYVDNEQLFGAVCVDLGYRRLRSKDSRTGKVTFKPLEYSEWEAILNQVRSRVTARLSQLKRGRRKQLLQEFYLPVLQDVEGFKDAFRNHVMHTRRHYTHMEANAIRDRVERFMRLLATRVREV
jgi:hypothetical protein